MGDAASLHRWHQVQSAIGELRSAERTTPHHLQPSLQF